MAHLPKRAWADFKKLQGLNPTDGSTVKFILDSSPFDDEEQTSTDYTFLGRILPASEPFNQSAYKVEMKLTNEYPGKPPKVRLLTRIHHPNVGEDGR